MTGSAKQSMPPQRKLDCFVASASRNDGVQTFPEQTGTKMTGAETLDVARDAIWTIVIVSSPLMVVGLVVGVVVSLFQALTQIQEQTLVFVPKILAIFVTLILALPFMADSLHSHMMRISSRIIGG
jgi:flagellar biosynthetic protein FliQ